MRIYEAGEMVNVSCMDFLSQRGVQRVHGRPCSGDHNDYIRQGCVQRAHGRPARMIVSDRGAYKGRIVGLPE